MNNKVIGIYGNTLEVAKNLKIKEDIVAIKEVLQAQSEKINNAVIKTVTLAYSELVELIDNNNLIPGQTYKINYEPFWNDWWIYVGNQIDSLIVFAISNNKLSPIAFNENLSEFIFIYSVYNKTDQYDETTTTGYIVREYNTFEDSAILPGSEDEGRFYPLWNIDYYRYEPQTKEEYLNNLLGYNKKWTFNLKFVPSNFSSVSSGVGTQYKAIHFPPSNSTIGYAVGSGGTILKTTNGGNSWSAITSGTIQGLTAVFFITSSTGWVCGDNGTLRKTTNGGSSWTAQSGMGTTQAVYIWFISTSVGWVCGASGTILKTTNGGSSWTAQTSGTTQSINGIHFINENVGYCCGGNGTILKTTNGGSSWTAQTSGTTQSLNRIQFVNENVGYCCGGGGTILKTTNGGSSWTALTSGTTQSLSDMHFITENQGIIVGTNGVLRRTTNGGSTWTQFLYGGTDWIMGVRWNTNTSFVVCFSSGGQIWKADIPFMTTIMLSNTVGDTPIFEEISKYFIKADLSGFMYSREHTFISQKYFRIYSENDDEYVDFYININENDELTVNTYALDYTSEFIINLEIIFYFT